MQTKKKITSISVQELLLGSEMKIFHIYDYNTNYSTYLRIVIRGLLARVPSLKNGKLPGSNFLNQVTRNKLIALTILYNKTIDRPVTFKKKEILYCCVLLPNKSRIDEDNGYASIKDWLEPSLKAEKERGWGIGVVENDKYLTGEARYAERIDVKTECCEIVVRKYSDVKEKSKAFLTFARFL